MCVSKALCLLPPEWFLKPNMQYNRVFYTYLKVIQWHVVRGKPPTRNSYRFSSLCMRLLLQGVGCLKAMFSRLVPSDWPWKWPAIPKDAEHLIVSVFSRLLMFCFVEFPSDLNIYVLACNCFFGATIHGLEIYITETDTYGDWTGKLYSLPVLSLALGHHPTSIDPAYLRTLALLSPSAATSSQRSFFAIPGCHKYLGSRVKGKGLYFLKFTQLSTSLSWLRRCHPKINKH